MTTTKNVVVFPMLIKAFSTLANQSQLYKIEIQPFDSCSLKSFNYIFWSNDVLGIITIHSVTYKFLKIAVKRPIPPDVSQNLKIKYQQPFIHNINLTSV